MKTFKSNCGCEIHVIKWSSKANSVTTKLCPLHKSAAKLLEALKRMAEWYGSTHDEGCPCDDTCNCSRKPFNDLVNSAINEAEGRD